MSEVCKTCGTCPTCNSKPYWYPYPTYPYVGTPFIPYSAPVWNTQTVTNPIAVTVTNCTMSNTGGA